MAIKLILFDCIQTVVDILKFPHINDYAFWAYHNCGYENYWLDFEAFTKEYIDAIREVETGLEQYQESNIINRFNLMVKRLNIDDTVAQKAVEAMVNNYWRNYKLNCYVDESDRSKLAELSKIYKCGIVSNFTVDGGVEELLQKNGINRYFDFVVTSIKVGWRKPHKKIFDAAWEYTQLPKEEILFVGDDYLCDYLGPLEYGFSAVHLDKKDISKATKRIRKLCELFEYLT